jgi:hypothetical protein
VYRWYTIEGRPAKSQKERAVLGLLKKQSESVKMMRLPWGP